MLNIQHVCCQKKLVKCFCILPIFVYFVLLHITYYNYYLLHEVCIIIDYILSLYLYITRREHLFMNFTLTAAFLLVPTRVTSNKPILIFISGKSFR